MKEIDMNTPGGVLRGIARHLGIPVGDFAVALAETFDRDLSTVQGYLYGRSSFQGDKEKSFESISSAVQRYEGGLIEPASLSKQQTLSAAEARGIREAWGRIKEGCRILWEISLNETFEDYVFQQSMEEDALKIELLDGIKSLFMELSAREAYKIYRNIEILARLTMKDMIFLSDIICLSDKERKQLAKGIGEQAICITAAEQLQLISNGELFQWLEMRDSSYAENLKYKGNDTENLWNKVCEGTLRNCGNDKLGIIVSFLITIYATDSSSALDKKLIDLMIMFKYCLSEQQREDVLKKYETRIEE